MIITIAGTAGSGKSTVGEMLARKLGYTLYCIGDIRREKAKSLGMTLEQYNRLGENDPSTDRDVDSYQAELARKNDNFIMIGRTSFHFIPQSFKIYLEVDPKIGARRILKCKRPEERAFSVDEMMQSIERRKISDILRYKKFYNIDVYDKRHFDLVIDTSNLSPEKILRKILDSIKK